MTRPLRIPVPLWPVLLFVVAFGLGPPLYVVARAAAEIGPAGLVATLLDPLNRLAIENSLLQGSLSALAAVALGYPLGVFLGRYDWPGRAWVRPALIVPFLLPTLVVVLGVEDLFGGTGLVSYWLPSLRWFGEGIPGIVAVNVAFNAPLVALLTAGAIESAPIEPEETIATLGGGPWPQYRYGWGPPSWRAALAGAFLTFAFSALSFAAPLLLCGPRCFTLEARVWSLSQVLLDPTGAAVLAGAMTALLLGPLVAYLWLLRAPTSSGQRAPRRFRPVPWGSVHAWAIVAASATAMAYLGLLLASILFRGITAAAPGGAPGSAWAALADPTTTRELGLPVAAALTNSLLFAAMAAALALILAILAGYPAREGRASGWNGVLFVALLISPILLAFASASVYRPALGGAGSVWLLIVLSQATLALPFAAQGLASALAALPARARESLETLGARRFVAYLEADLPRVRPAFLTAGLFAFALGLGEFTATYFLATPAFTTLPVAMYHLEGLRAPGLADALGALLVGASLAVFGLVQRAGGRVLA